MASASPERFEELLESIAIGTPISKACQAVGFPRCTLYRELDKEGEEGDRIRDKYARARELQADAHADRIMELSEDVLEGKYDYNSARVAIDALKWAASKLRPKVYGDRIEVDSKRDVTVTVVLGQALPNALTPNALMPAIEAHVTSHGPAVPNVKHPKRRRGPKPPHAPKPRKGKGAKGVL